MIWKIAKNSFIPKEKRIEFIPQEFEESTEELQNPVRGWYTIYPFLIEKSINPEELKWCLRDQESVALVQLNLGAYREKPLDFFALKNCKEILQFFKHYGKDVILRPVYDLEGKGMEHEPETIDLVLKHLEQLGDMLGNMEHSVYVFQGLLIGSWGEMHSSRFMSEQDIKSLYDGIKPYLGDEIFLTVRTPAIWRKLIRKPSYEERVYYNLGLFHDAMFSSPLDMGTYGTMTSEAAGWRQSWNRSEEIRFMSLINEQIPYGGEALSGETRSIKSIVSEMCRLHVSYLNQAYDKKRLDEWKQEVWKEEDDYKGKSGYDYISMHMGYRYVLRTAKQKATCRRLGKIELQVEIENVGFGSCCQDIELLVSVENGATIYEKILNENLKKWKAREKKTITICLPQLEGKVYLKAYRKQDKRPIYFANKNSELPLLGILS